MAIKSIRILGAVTTKLIATDFYGRGILNILAVAECMVHTLSTLTSMHLRAQSNYSVIMIRMHTAQEIQQQQQQQHCPTCLSFNDHVHLDILKTRCTKFVVFFCTSIVLPGLGCQTV